MSDEALALPSTIFEVLSFLSTLFLTGFCLVTVATVQMDGTPAFVAQALFSLLVVVYVLIYEFAFDMNRPFYGIYQLRRSSAAMHLLQIKMLYSNHPFLGELVDFEEVLDESDAESLSGFVVDPERKRRTWYY